MQGTGLLHAQCFHGEIESPPDPSGALGDLDRDGFPLLDQPERCLDTKKRKAPVSTRMPVGVVSILTDACGERARTELPYSTPYVPFGDHEKSCMKSRYSHFTLPSGHVAKARFCDGSCRPVASVTVAF